MENKICLIELTVSYNGKIDAVHQLTLDIPRGCAFALLGRNGAGKTTVLKSLSGMLEPDGGDVSVFGYDPYRDPVSVKAMLAYVSDQNLYPLWMTAHQALALLKDFFPRYDAVLAERIAEAFRLDLGKKLKTLSLGQLRQFNLLAALVRRPEVLVLDEPTIGLDVPARRRFTELVIEQMEREHCTVIYSSHLISELEGVVEKIAVIDQGKLLLTADLEQLKDSIFSVTTETQFVLPPGLEILREETAGSRRTLLVRGDRRLLDSHETEALDLEELFVRLTAD